MDPRRHRRGDIDYAPAVNLRERKRVCDGCIEAFTVGRRKTTVKGDLLQSHGRYVHCIAVRGGGVDRRLAL